MAIKVNIFLVRLMAFSIALLLLSCSSTKEYRHYKAGKKFERLPHIEWHTKLKWDKSESNFSGGKVEMSVNGKDFLISKNPFGKYTPFNRELYKSYEVPESSVSVVNAFFAGYGEIFYVRVDDINKQLQVHSIQYTDGADAYVSPAKLVALLQFKK